MIGNYARWYGQLVRIIDHNYGVATIKVIKTKRLVEVSLFQLQPVALRNVSLNTG